MEQSLADEVLRLSQGLSSIPGITQLEIDGFIKTYLHIRAYGIAYKPESVSSFFEYVFARASNARHATLLRDLTDSLDAGFRQIIVTIKAKGQKLVYVHHGLWSWVSDTDSDTLRVRPKICASQLFYVCYFNDSVIMILVILVTM